MSEQRSYDAVIVGGGVIGLACAWRLAQAGATVAVLERDERPPAGATRVAAGMLAPVGELTFGEPELLELTLVAAELYPGFVAELEQASGVATGYSVRGALHVALDRDEAEQLRRVHDLQRSMGLEAEWLPPRACRDLEPGLTPSLSGGVIAPGEGSVDPRALSAALLAALEREGVEVRTGTEVSEAPARGRADRRRADRRRRGAARRLRRPRLRRLVGPRRVAARARPPAGAPGQGPDPRAALARRRGARRSSGSSPPSASTSCRAPTGG